AAPTPRVYLSTSGRGALVLESTPGGLVERSTYPVGGQHLAVSPSGDRVYTVGSFSGRDIDFDPTHAYRDHRDRLTTGKHLGGGYYTEDFILELTPNSTTGQLQFAWVGQVGPGGATDYAWDVAIDSSGTYFLGWYGTPNGSGRLYDPVYDFDPGPG